MRLVGREQRGYLGGQRLDLGGVLGDSSREQPHGAVLAGHGRRTGLSDDPAEPRGAAALARPRPRVSAPTVCGDVSAIDRGPPTGGMSLGVAASGRSARDSNSGHDSSSMLRSLFLFPVFLRVGKSLWAASDLAASVSGGLSATGSGASGMPGAVFAAAIASRSSVLASPAKSLGVRARRGLAGMRAAFPRAPRARARAT